MNFVLDIGNVLITFQPKVFLQSLFSDEVLEKKLHQIIFQSPEWKRMDKGLLTRDEANLIICEREPDYMSAIKHVMRNLPLMLTPIPETVALLPKIKEAGHMLYYLSNYSKEGSTYALKEYSFFDCFDGGVFSCDVNITKPDIEIYKLFLRKYQLWASDCIFFDDVEENVKAAESIGMMGEVFTEANDIKRYI